MYVCRRRRKVYCFTFVATLCSVCVCFLLLSRLPQVQLPSEIDFGHNAAGGESRETVMNGKREILHVNAGQSKVAIVEDDEREFVHACLNMLWLPCVLSLLKVLKSPCRTFKFSIPPPLFPPFILVIMLWSWGRVFTVILYNTHSYKI